MAYLWGRPQLPLAGECGGGKNPPADKLRKTPARETRNERKDIVTPNLRTNMIYGIGIDMVEVSRIEKALDRWGDRFLKRIFTQAEIEYCRHGARTPSRFALRFAAKEAFSKALGLGFRKGLGLKHVEVVRDPNGHPRLSLHTKARELCKHNGIKNSFLSLSDDGPYAIAVVVLEV